MLTTEFQKTDRQVERHFINNRQSDLTGVSPSSRCAGERGNRPCPSIPCNVAGQTHFLPGGQQHESLDRKQRTRYPYSNARTKAKRKWQDAGCGIDQRKQDNGRAGARAKRNHRSQRLHQAIGSRCFAGEGRANGFDTKVTPTCIKPLRPEPLQHRRFVHFLTRRIFHVSTIDHDQDSHSTSLQGS